MPLLAAAFGAAVLASPARAEECPASKPEVTLSLRLPEPVIDSTHTQRQLQGLASKEHHGGRTLGLYRMELVYGMEAAVLARESQGRLCQWIERVTVKLVLNPRQIFVVRDRKPGTCPYEAVLDHERKHQVVDDQVFREFAPRMKLALETAISRLPREQPIPASEAERGKAQLTAPVKKALRSAVNAVMAERDARQRRVDSADEYTRVRGACG